MQYSTLNLSSISYDYDYPEGLDFTPTSKLHGEILGKLTKYAREAQTLLSNRIPTWDRVDKSLMMYVDLSEAEKNMKKAKIRPLLPIVVPQSYTALETVLTYMMQIFSDSPRFRFRPTGPEDLYGVMALENLVEYQFVKQRMLLNLHTLMRDAFAYGIGMAAPVWVTEKGVRYKLEEEQGMLGLLKSLFNRAKKRRTSEEYTAYEGNRLQNVSPRNLLVDANVSIYDYQDAEFLGWMSKTTLMALLKEERLDDSYFNCKYLKHLDSSELMLAENSNSITQDYTPDQNSQVSNSVGLTHLYVTLIPSDWKLGDGEDPEKWLFTYAGSKIIVRAMPLGLDHDKYPAVFFTPTNDGYQAFPMGLMESILGFNEASNFMMNAMLEEMRRGVNGRFLVNPAVFDLTSVFQDNGGFYLTKPISWGRSLNDAIMPMPVSNIAQQNLQHLGILSSMVEETTAATNSAKGQPTSTGDRRTATQDSGERSAAFARMNKYATIFGTQVMGPLGAMLAAQTQQLLSEEVRINLEGGKNDLYKAYAKVRPEDISVDFDVVSEYGINSKGDMIQLGEVLKTVVASDILAQRFDIVGLFKRYCHLSGLTDMDDFDLQSQARAMKIQAATRSDEEVQNEVDKGNLVPVQPQEVPLA